MSPDLTHAITDLRDDVSEIFAPTDMILMFYGAYLPILAVERMGQASLSISGRDEDGIFMVANWPYPNRFSTALGGNQTVMTTGLMAAMAIPAFQKVRENSRQKTITNNLRQVASGGQQYLLEEGVDSVRYEQLVPTYFAPITPVAGEDYSGLVVKPSGTLEVTTSAGATVTYNY